MSVIACCPACRGSRGSWRLAELGEDAFDAVGVGVGIGVGHGVCGRDDVVALQAAAKIGNVSNTSRNVSDRLWPHLV